MPDSMLDEIEQGFEDALRKALREVSECTPFGVKNFRRKVERVGAVEAARDALELRESILGDFSFPATDDYFDAAIRVGRPELTVESLVLQEPYRKLFEADERKEAGRRLGIPRPYTIRRALPRHSPEWEELHRHDGYFEFRLFERETSLCAFTRKVAEGRSTGETPQVEPEIRRHLTECAKCKEEHPKLVEAYRNFDKWFFDVLNALLMNFETVSKFDDERLEYFLPATREELSHMSPDAENGDEEWATFCEFEFEQIRPILYWRAIRLGSFIGEAMRAYSRKWSDTASSWNHWLAPNAEEFPVPELKHAIGTDRLDYARLALKLSTLIPVEFETKQTHWLANAGDEAIEAIPGVLWTEQWNDIPDWEQAHGPTPQLQLHALFDTAAQAASNIVVGLAATDREVAELDRMFALRPRPRIAKDLSPPELTLIWPHLDKDSHQLLRSGELLFHDRGIESPGLVICAWAQAFELTLKRVLLSAITNSLRANNRTVLDDGRTPATVLWKPNWPSRNYTLGGILRILRSLNSCTRGDLAQFGFELSKIERAIEIVRGPRDTASHGTPMNWDEVLKHRYEFFGTSPLHAGVFDAIIPRRRA